MELGESQIPHLESSEHQIPNDAIPPYLKAARTKFVEQFPQHTSALDTVINEVTQQGHKNWTTFTSESFPGVAFDYTTIKLHEELVKKIAGNENYQRISKTTQEDNKKEHVFLFPGSASYEDGHPFAGIDVALNKVILELPRVARAMRTGEQIPEIEIIMPGSPRAIGGQMTQDFLDQLDTKGFETYGKLFAEFIEKTLPADTAADTDAHIELDGYSQGATIVSSVINNLSPALIAKTQTLLDNPAGTHKPGILRKVFKGGQIALGLGAEIAVRVSSDQITKDINKEKSQFNEYLTQRHNLTLDEGEALKRKKDAFKVEALGLIVGSPLNTDGHRHFIRESLKDTLGTGPTRFLRARKAHKEALKNGYERSQMAAQDKGKSFTSLTKNGTHLWPYQQHDKWDRRFTFIKNALSTPQPLTEAE